ncbi:dihydrolipoamide acetyltransferase family protein [Shouchella lonarensis]|uniref:Dihydrolipoamide acetyltransferase component of pyruvate dehydrogenase complex n=1 Tax=Shouchella lonarensis TaxID=1464122 RepID=A0A1G6HBQ7_9BACI|nr:pyruvate dehydrogenase E2 component (dihydrolipoamide acetyltransferase) [Shouchella lonarensis]
MIEVKLHDIGEGMSEGEILQYFVKVGDQVDMDQPLVEVQTDKVAAEIAAPQAGIVKAIEAKPGETIAVGTTLIVLESEGAMRPSEISHTAVAVAEAPPKTEKKAPARSLQRVLAAPYTRKIAREHGIDITDVVGTGPGGRVLDEDVYAFVQQQSAPEKTPAVEKIVPAPVSPQTSTKTMPFTGRRKQIAKKMTESIYTIPHVTHFEEADVTALIAWRKQCKEAGRAFSLSAYFVKTLALTLRDFPIFNAELDEEQGEIRLHEYCHIGLATEAKEGLIVPVLKHVEQKSLLEIDQEMKVLTKKAQDNELSAAQLQGGTFTVSNVGPLGGIGATPIINAPQTALMAIHKTKRRPIVTANDEITIGDVMTMSLSFDHRVADGATAVAFTNRWVTLLEDPTILALELI